MTKPSTRKKRRKAPGKSRKTTSRRNPQSQNQNRGAQAKTKKITPVEAAPLRRDAPANEKEREEEIKKPLIIRAELNFYLTAGSFVISVVFGWLWLRSVGHTHGMAGEAKIAAVTILPLIAVMYALRMVQRGFRRAGVLGRTARMKVLALCFAVLLVLPGFWQKTGYEQICWHTFLGGVIGFAVAFISWSYLAVKRHPWLLQQEQGQWLWAYRLSATGMIIIGGWIGVIIS